MGRVSELMRDLLCYDGMDVANVDELVEALAEEIDKVNKRVTTLSRECGIADMGDSATSYQTTAQRCREDNERI